MDFNASIAPLDRRRSNDDFSDALEIARTCSLAKPTLSVSSEAPLTFDEGLIASADFHSITVSSSEGSMDVRSLIATLTTQDAAAVADVRSATIEQLAELRDRVWTLSPLRGDYQALLDRCPLHIAGFVGLIIGAAQQNKCTIIEGVDAFAAALLAQRLAYRATDRVLAAQLPSDSAEIEAQRRLRLPVVLATKVPKSASLVALGHLETTLSLTDS